MQTSVRTYDRLTVPSAKLSISENISWAEIKKTTTYKPENNKFCKSEKITDTTIWQRNLKFIGHIYAKRAEDDSEKRQPSMLNYEKQ